MKLGTYVATAVSKLEENGIFSGKTNVQKIIYFSLPAKERNIIMHITMGPTVGWCRRPWLHCWITAF